MTARTAVRWTAGAVLCAALGLLVGVLGHREVCVTVTAPAKPATPAAEIGQPLSRIPQATRGCTQPSGLPLGVLSGGGALLLLGAAALPGPRRRRGPHAAPDPGDPQRDELVASVLYAIDRASSPAVAARLAQDLERVGV